MANLFDYIAWRGDLDFKASCLNPVDLMIFSQISYLPFDGIVSAPGEKNGISLQLALETMLKNKSRFDFKEDPDLVEALIKSARFRNCYLSGYVNQVDNEKEKQFSALCFYTEKKSPVIIFRGTDTSFIGWKEDFNMAFREVIPSQQEAVNYLEKMARYLHGDLRIAGHSKGGNLAVYAASFCNEKTQKRIKEVYSFDAPGFHEKIILSENYIRIKNKVNYYIPQGSIIGMILEHGSNYKVVKSTQKGLLQHFLYSWEVTINDLVKAEKLNLSSKFIDKTIREWIDTLDFNQREQFVEGLYKILQTSEVKSVREMEASWLLTLGRIIKSIGNIDEDTRKLTLKTISDLFKTAGRNMETLFKRQDSEI